MDDGSRGARASTLGHDRVERLERDELHPSRGGEAGVVELAVELLAAGSGPQPLPVGQVIVELRCRDPLAVLQREAQRVISRVAGTTGIILSP
jgi:hypothetical protein